MLLIFRPFKVGDYVEVGGETGVVVGIELFTTELKSVDNKRIIMPNSAIFGANITNYAHHPVRRVDVPVGTDYGADIDETLCLDPRAVESALTERTKAVVVVHMCGAMARIDELQAICSDKGVTLIEDACQSVGASFGGKALGTFGRMGCFSFDPVKTITCGEGGAVITDDPKLYELAHAFADHGHDHIGDDRGAEGHPILGYNYRISELNAAVGLAQLRKLDTILETQRRHKAAIKTAMAEYPDITFRHLPDESGDSATFLSFMMSSEAHARKTAQALNGAGVDGCFYWYDNNWHYYRKWHHLKQMQAAADLPLKMSPHRPDYSKLALPQSDAIMGRTISMQIKLGWGESQLEARISAMRKVLEKTG